MFLLISVLCFLTNAIIGSSSVNNELIERDTKRKYNLELKAWHSHDVADGEYSFVVELILIDQEIVTRHCTGSMIHRSWVLSASHCFHDLRDKKFYVWYGNYTISPLESKLYSSVLKIFIHPAFQNTGFTRPGFFFGDNDISLLRVGKVIMQNYGRLSTIDHTKMSGLPVTYIGGATKKQASDQFRPLQIGEGVVIKCGMSLTMWSKYVLCVTPKCFDKSHHPLHGDFGGPFLYNGKIVGVMSLNFQIPKSQVSSNGLTPVSPYKKWIKHVVRSKWNS